MKKVVYAFVAAACVAGIQNANATLIGGPAIIGAPTSVADDAPGAENTAQQAFDEKQNVTLADALEVDGGIFIAAGTVVDSHMIFLNTDGRVRTTDTQTWTFSGIILGVMSDPLGNLEAASNSILGASGTTYPGAFNARGMENNNSDWYQLLGGNSISVKMTVTEPGDWIRVVTASNVPDGGVTAGLFGLGLVALGYGARRKK